MCDLKKTSVDDGCTPNMKGSSYRYVQTKNTVYTTKVTKLGNGYGCRVLREGAVIVEARCQTKMMIGATLRDLLRTIDKCGGDSFTSAARKRKYREGSPVASVRHFWVGEVCNAKFKAEREYGARNS